MKLLKSNFGTYLHKIHLKTGIMLSLLAVVTFFVDIPVATGTPQLIKQSIAGLPCEMEDESDEDGQGSPTIVTFSKKCDLGPRSTFLIEVFDNIAYGEQSPPEIPPKAFSITIK